MIAHSIECNNPKCNNRLTVQIRKAMSEPILFCSQDCFDSVLSQSEKASDNYNYENPEELRHLVKNLVALHHQNNIQLLNLVHLIDNDKIMCFSKS